MYVSRKISIQLLSLLIRNASVVAAHADIDLVKLRGVQPLEFASGKAPIERLNQQLLAYTKDS